MRSLGERLAARPADTAPSPCDRFLARRRAIFVRDWILALIALGLILAATVFR
jgi:hypothetical protein